MAAGLEAVVGREVRELGYDCQVENGRVRFQGDARAIIETNLWLRAADRIKIIVGTFPAKTFEELFQGVFALDWEIIYHSELGSRFQKPNVLSPNFTMNQVYRQFLRKLLSRNCRNTMLVQKVFL